MGAKPSSEAAPEDTFVDYYELLEVEQTDSADAIRKSYRRLALRMHPDKNPGQEEEAKKRFVKLQEAYEVLSDEQERAWYDQNRERLIHGIEEEEDDDDVDAKFQFFRSGGAAPKAATMAAGVGVSHLLRFYAPSLAKDFSDSSTSFFGTYRRLFERLAEEDMVAAPYPGETHTGDLPLHGGTIRECIPLSDIPLRIIPQEPSQYVFSISSGPNFLVVRALHGRTNMTSGTRLTVV